MVSVIRQGGYKTSLACQPVLIQRQLCPPVTPAPFVSRYPRDEDMQSLASLMSVKPTDIGNLDDFADSEEDAEEAPKRSRQEDGMSQGAASKGGGILPVQKHCRPQP